VQVSEPLHQCECDCHKKVGVLKVVPIEDLVDADLDDEVALRRPEFSAIAPQFSGLAAADVAEKQNVLSWRGEEAPVTQHETELQRQTPRGVCRPSSLGSVNVARIVWGEGRFVVQRGEDGEDIGRWIRHLEGNDIDGGTR